MAEQWPFESATKRCKDAIKWRWKKVLKRLDALDDLRLICGSCDEREEAETQMNTEASLQPWVEDALVKLHARKNVSMNSNLHSVDDRGGPPPVALVPERREDH